MRIDNAHIVPVLYNKDEDPLLTACKEFESIFINQLFKSMRRTVPEGGMLEKGMGEEVFESFLDEEIAREAAHGNSYGLAHMLYNQLKNPGG